MVVWEGPRGNPGPYPDLSFGATASPVPLATENNIDSNEDRRQLSVRQLASAFR